MKIYQNSSGCHLSILRFLAAFNSAGANQEREERTKKAREGRELWRRTFVLFTAFRGEVTCRRLFTGVSRWHLAVGPCWLLAVACALSGHILLGVAAGVSPLLFLW